MRNRVRMPPGSRQRARHHGKRGERLQVIWLDGMRERVLLRSGDFYIQGTPGQGTTVVIKLPLINGQEAR